MNPTTWSPDGRFVVYDVRTQKGTMDMWLLSMADRKARPLLVSDYDEGQAVISPDGRWIAYISNESGRGEVYVCAFRPDGSVEGKWMVSRGVASWHPHWRADSKELVYVGADSSLMPVAVLPGEQFQAGSPKAFGKVPERTVGAFSPDGKRVLAPLPVTKDEPARFTVVLNGQSGLGRAR